MNDLSMQKIIMDTDNCILVQDDGDNCLPYLDSSIIYLCKSYIVKTLRHQLVQVHEASNIICCIHTINLCFSREQPHHNLLLISVDRKQMRS